MEYTVMIYHWKPLLLMSTVLAITSSTEGRPTEDNAGIVIPSKSDQLQMAEHRILENDAPVRSLPFYGGAKGKYLLIHPSGRTSITHRNPAFYGLKGDEDDEEDVGMESEGEPDESDSSNSTSGSGNPDESVSVGLPPDNASVAEAKPVGLAIAGPGGVASSRPVGTAIAGPGGVASSRPVGTAVVGPGGLALAKPVATAIAGVQGSEQLVGLPGGKKKYDKPKISTTSTMMTNKTRQHNESSVSGRSNDDDTNLEYSSKIGSQEYNMLYIPLNLSGSLN